MSKIKIAETISETPYARVSYCYLNGVKAVLKTKKEAIITNSISTELEIHQFFSNYDLCPEIVEFDQLKNHIIYEKLQHSVEDSGCNQAFLEIFGESVKKLHCLNYQNHDLDTFKDKIESYRNILGSNSTNEIQKGFALFDNLYKNPTKLVFCHNDLNPMNIFLDKKMRFIDWEYAGVNMPIYEIASIKKSFNFSSDQFKIFLKAYGEDFNLDDINEFEILVECIERIWQEVTEKQKKVS